MPKHPQVLGHWHSLIEGFATSSLDFYGLVKAGIVLRQIPDLTISEVEWKEGGLGSGKRVYLRVSREGLNFDICAAPFGTGYLSSWSLAVIPRIFLDFAVLASALGGKAIETDVNRRISKLLRPLTVAGSRSRMIIPIH